MKGKYLKLGLVISFVAMFAALPFLGACAPKEISQPDGSIPSDEGISTEKGIIKVGLFGAYTGPYAEDVAWTGDAWKLYWDWINEKYGGVNGMPVEVLWVDGGMQVAKCIPYLYRWAEEGIVCAYGSCSTYTVGLKSMVDELKIPISFGPATKATVSPPGYCYHISPTYPDYLGAFIDWLAGIWNEDRPPRLALLCVDVPYSRAVDIPEVYDYMEQKGVQHAGTEYLSLTATDSTPQLRRLADAGVDWIWMPIPASGKAVVFKDMERLGLLGKVGTAAGFALDSYTWRAVGGQLQAGLLDVSYLPQAGDEDESAEQKEWDSVSLGNGIVHRHVCHPAIFYMASCYREAMERALDSKGYPITGADVATELNKFNNEDIHGVKITFGPDRRAATYRATIYEWVHTPGTQWADGINDVSFVRACDWFEGPQLIGKEYWTK